MQPRLLNSLRILVLLISVISISANAQWVQKSNGLEGGAVSSILIDGSMIFASSFTGVFRASTKDMYWAAANKGLPPGEARHLAGTATNLFVGTQVGVYRSTDSGATWTASNTGLAQNIRSLRVVGSRVFAGTSSGVFVSDNNGASWVAINDGLPSNSDIRFITDDGSTVYLCAPMGVYQSVNGGASWEIVGSTLLGSFQLVQKGNVLFAAGAGVFKSQKVGSSWSDWTTVGNGLPAATIPTMKLNGNNLIVGSSDGVYESNDDGASWHPLNNGIPEDIAVWSLAESGGNLLAGTMRGIYLSENGGIKWIPMNQGLTNPVVSSFVENEGILYAGTDCGIFKTSNGGDTWTRTIEGISGTGLYTRAMAADGTVVYAGTQGGIYRSSDNGVTWEAANSGIPAIHRLVNAFVIHGNAIFVGMLMAGNYDDEVIFKSTDQGVSWTSASGGLPANGGASALASANGILYAVVDGSIYSSVNNGDSWTLVKPGYYYAGFLKFDGTNLYFPLSVSAVYKSPDNGVTWSSATESLSGVHARTIEPVGEALYLGTSSFSNVVYMSNDQGASWLPAGVGLPRTANNVLYATSDKLFGGFLGDGGIWSRSLPDFISHLNSFSPSSGAPGTQVTISGNNFSLDPAANVVLFNGVAATVTASTATSVTVVVPQTASTGKVTVTANGQTVTSTSDFTVEEMITAVSPTNGESGMVLYPNPSSDFINLDFGNNFNGHATVSVYSSTGRLINVVQRNNGNTIAIDVKNLTPGSYFIEVVERDKLKHKRFIKL